MIEWVKDKADAALSAVVIASQVWIITRGGERSRHFLHPALWEPHLRARNRRDRSKDR